MTVSIQRAEAPTNIIRPVERSSLSGFSRADREVIREVIYRDWRSYLSPAERDLLYYIFAASIDRGFDVLDCTWDQLSRGVRAIGKTITKWLIPPIGTSRATFYRLLNHLTRKGIVAVSSAYMQCTRIKINLDWSPETGIMAPKLAVSKRKLAEENAQKEIATSCNSGRNDGSSVSQIETPYIGTIISRYPSTKDNLTQRSACVGRTIPIPNRKVTGGHTPDQTNVTPLSTRSIVQAAEQKSKSTRKEKADRSRAEDKLTAFRATFSNAWSDTFPAVSVPGWTAKEGHMLRASLKSRFPSVPDRHAFLEFVVRNWARIITEKFGWMQRPAPATPSLQFLLASRIIPTFMDAWAERVKLMANRVAPADDRQIERLMDSGLTRDDALVKLGERRAMSRTMTERQTQAVDATLVVRQRAQIEALQKQALRDKAKVRQQGATKDLEDPPRPPIGNELPEFKIEPIDPSKWTDIK